MSAARVRIDGIAAGGAGVGRLDDGRVVFVHRTAPGDVADIRVVRERGRWAQATLVALVEQGPGRREAPCPHYARCGGCTLEHLEYAHQRDAKARLVQEALRRIGRIEDAPLPEVVASPHEFRYRNRVSFKLLRTSGGRVIAGFHELERPDRVLDIGGACLLPEQPVADAWHALRAAWGDGAGRLPAGRALRLTLRGTADGHVTLLVEGGHGPGEPDALLDAVPALRSIWHQARAGVEPRLLAGESRIEERWGGNAIGVAGALFLQVNRHAAALLEAHVLALAGDVAGAHVVDAYCGVGLHARRLAARCARVTGIEVDARALDEARRAAPAGITWIEGEVERHIAAALPAALVIVNPPRAGVDAAAAGALRAAPPARLIYVSCDPATLARDIARLGSGVTLRSLRCFDLFPQTSHVETVAELTCATS
jgi:23S rRNA (uracil1939-C5)-methyltransferase